MIAACTIAGSDSGGGAGIQADLRTFAAFAVWGLSVVTAVTAQNTREVRRAWMLPVEAVEAQIAAVCDDFFIGAFKTGMLGERGIVRAVAGALPEGVPLVVDPVMISTSGHTLLAPDAVADVVRLLVPRAAIVTPNLPEAEALAGIPVRRVSDMAVAGKRIRDLGAEAVVVKGGHLSGGVAVDVLVDAEGVLALEGRMYPYPVHGSGCCFASALAALLARGCGVREAFSAAKEFMETAVREAAPGSGGVRIANPGGSAFIMRRDEHYNHL
ncbi:MAG: bifunctional hydroxymethylpyrimidine kinase/phosphomethylpyrimidine kinase [Methanomicrobiaceae archaeon]|nr:bifunctional hydroxymethylpyrimidine kinase/phosphomethylpyrimidine kinase [Methanomicrobiaceae archaeon]